MRLLIAFSLLALVLVLPSCTTAQKAAAQLGIQKVKDAHDASAVVTLMLPCGIRVGSFYRVLTPNQQRATAALCGGEPMSTDRFIRVRPPASLGTN